jgi:hypothetical protein
MIVVKLIITILTIAQTISSPTESNFRWFSFDATIIEDKKDYVTARTNNNKKGKSGIVLNVHSINQKTMYCMNGKYKTSGNLQLVVEQFNGRGYFLRENKITLNKEDTWERFLLQVISEKATEQMDIIFSSTETSPILFTIKDFSFQPCNKKSLYGN